MAEAKVVQKNGEEPIPAEILAQSIVDISAAMKKLNSTRLTRKALIVLIAAQSSGLRRGDIQTVLECLDSLERAWLTPKAAIKK